MPVPRQRIKEKSRLLPQEAIDIMTAWYNLNYTSPYPTFRDCEQMAHDGKISINQVKQWFVNVRRRTQNEFRIKRQIYNSSKSSSEAKNTVDSKFAYKIESIINQQTKSRNISAALETYRDDNSHAYQNVSSDNSTNYSFFHMPYQSTSSPSYVYPISPVYNNYNVPLNSSVSTSPSSTYSNQSSFHSPHQYVNTSYDSSNCSLVALVDNVI